MKSKQTYDLTSPADIKQIIEKLSTAAFQSATSVNQDGEDCVLYLNEDTGNLNSEVHQKNGHIRIDEYNQNGYCVSELSDGRWDENIDTLKNSMTMIELQNIMMEHGLVIRAIPKIETMVMETRHIDKYPDGEIKFLEDYKREMLVVEKELSLGGKFIITQAKHQLASIQFEKKNVFNSIEKCINNFLKNK